MLEDPFEQRDGIVLHELLELREFVRPEAALHRAGEVFEPEECEAFVALVRADAEVRDHAPEPRFGAVAGLGQLAGVVGAEPAQLVVELRQRMARHVEVEHFFFELQFREVVPFLGFVQALAELQPTREAAQ